MDSWDTRGFVMDKYEEYATIGPVEVRPVGETLGQDEIRQFDCRKVSWYARKGPVELRQAGRTPAGERYRGVISTRRSVTWTRNRRTSHKDPAGEKGQGS
jgi:hypothetical protein